MAGQVFAIASGKGGVGKTTTVVNLGVVLRRADHTVALVDADLGMANLGSLLGISSDVTLHDVLAGRSTLEDALVEEAPGFAVLVGSDSVMDYPEADPRALGDVLDMLAESYDFVLVDTGAGMSHEDVLPLGLADRVILVASPDPAAIGDTRKTAELAGLAAGDIAGLVVTKADPSTDAKHVASQVGVDLLGVIPYDPTVRESTAAGRPLEAVDPDTPAATAYRELATTLANGSADPLTRTPVADSEASAPADEADSPSTEPESDTGQPDAPGPDEADFEVADPDEAAAVEPEAADDEVMTDDSAESEGAEDSEAVAAEPSEADDDGATEENTGPEEAGPDDATTEGRTDSEADSADDSAEPDEVDDSEEDPLAEFEDDEPERKGGFLARISRLFR